MKPRWHLPLALLLWALAVMAQAALQFPPLTGRVMDQAGLLDSATAAQLGQQLQAHEQASGEQVVVVTLPDLQGNAIEDYGYQLGRAWGIGQKGKDNGALLIVAKAERKVRIEVGYGLEDRLTDAQSSLIINRVIVPAFARGDFAGGISEGTAAIIQVLGGDPLAQPREDVTAQGSGERQQLPWPAFLILIVIVVLMLRGGGGRGGGGGRSVLTGAVLGSVLGGGGSSGGLGGGGGFGGGGGSFGGGGASGSW